MTEPLLEPRRAAAAVAVDDALIVIGGAMGERPLDSAVMLDGGTWKSLAPLPQARMGLASVRDKQGVVVAGGHDGKSALSSVYRLKNIKGNWAGLPSMAHARAGLALFSVGRNLLAAGGRQTTGITGECEILDWRRKEWKPCSRVPVPTAYPAFAVLEGEAWFIGGLVRRDGKEFPTDVVWIYDLKNDFWRKGPKLPAPMSHSGAALGDGKLWVAGGLDEAGNPSPRVLRYHSNDNSWIETFSLPTPRAEAATTAWKGNLAVLGGRSREPAGLRVVEYYAFRAPSWTTNDGTMRPPLHWERPIILPPPAETDSLPVQTALTAPRWGAAVVEYRGNPVLIGGADKNRFLNFVEALQPGTFEWRAMAPLRRARAGLAAATDGKRIVVTGGSDQGGPMDFAEMYDPEAHDWFPITPMLKARSGHALIWMPKGPVCAWGGMGRDGPEPGLECWDGKNWRRSEIDKSIISVPPVFDGANAEREYRGRVTAYAFGGRTIRGGVTVMSVGGASMTSSRSDRTDAAFVTIANAHTPIPTPRAAAAAARQPDDCPESDQMIITAGKRDCGDRYYVAGGVGADEIPSDKLEVYGPAMAWTVAASMPTPRANAAAFIRDGRLFVVGGKDADGNALDAIETYDSKTNRWASVNNRLVVRNAFQEAETIKAKVPIRPRDVAVIIGIDGYRSLPPASYAEADARGYRKRLLSLGVPEENLVILGGEKASRNDVVKYIEEWLPTQVHPDSNVYVVFSGHGAPKPDDGTAYLVPWDGDASFLKTTAYALDEFLDHLNALRARNIFVVMDACFSGTGGRSVIARGVRPLVAVKTQVKSWDRLTIFSASESRQIAGGLDDKKSGLFSYHMLNGLGGAADADRDGHITAAELHSYVRPRVVVDARREGREQTPTLRAVNTSLRIY